MKPALRPPWVRSLIDSAHIVAGALISLASAILLLLLIIILLPIWIPAAILLRILFPACRTLE